MKSFITSTPDCPEMTKDEGKPEDSGGWPDDEAERDDRNVAGVVAFSGVELRQGKTGQNQFKLIDQRAGAGIK